MVVNTNQLGKSKNSEESKDYSVDETAGREKGRRERSSYVVTLAADAKACLSPESTKVVLLDLEKFSVMSTKRASE